MEKLIESFPQHILEAIKITENVQFSRRETAIQHVLICGLGGSGIGGDLVTDLTAAEITVPIIVNKGYELPAFADADTLLILCSYSGNTEETLSCAEEAIRRGLKPVCIASGGKLKELATANGFDFIELPGGFPPRTTLGFGSTILFYVLDSFGLIDLSVGEEMTAVSEFLTANQAAIKTESQALAKKLGGKTVIAYAEDRIKSVALRLKQQINENAKSNCWINAIPELNHNELVGWRFKNDTLAALYLRTDYENPRNVLRFDFIKPTVADHVSALYEVRAKGESLLQQYFYHVHFGDWLSYYMALEHGVDPVEVNVIDALKGHLSSVAQ
ncbi:MAG: bifunctional phosphoglucose/phosphomannose isomerase [Bacteroidetes bacterium]|nr:bifunctional phosphoglucose/phosphomannose isomerase [Bacteroidota bacterium]